MKIFFILLIMFFCLSGCNSNTQNNSTYTPTKTSYQENPNTTTQKQSEEIEISTFSTPIIYKDENRDYNMALTCSILNGTIVKSNETFSFCDTVGKATPEKGYKEAEIFDNKGNIQKGYGGGNCQVSSTLYNAVLAVPDFTVVERHAHSRTVSYVEKGKDAAIAYGSIDFKFKNNSKNDIKIYSTASADSINIRIVEIKF